MLPDDKNNEDEFDNDFDVEDDFDDGFDEDWDDEPLDDPIPEMPADDNIGVIVDESVEPTIGDTIDAPAAALPTGEKTFIQKFFVPIVVGIVALFGILFVLGSGLLSGSSDQIETPAVENVEIADNQAQPETPAIEPEDSMAQNEELPDLPSQNEPLTPLPGSEPPAEETFELVDLEAELQDDSESFDIADGGNIDILETPTALEGEIENVEAVIEDTENVIEDMSELDDTLPTIDDMDVSDTEELMPDSMIDENDISVETLVDSSQDSPSDDQNAATSEAVDVSDIDEEAPIEEAADEPLAENTDDEVFNAEDAAIESIEEAPAQLAEIDALEDATDTIETVVEDTADNIAEIDSNNEALKEEIVESRETIEALRQELETLKAQIDTAPAPTVNEAAANTEIPNILEVNEEKPAEDITKPQPIETVVETAKSEPKPAAVQKKVQPKKQTIRWELKSAQPGQATLSQKGSNDLRTVETGQNVCGLGRKTSIQIENGLWVVRGTKGSVSQ